MELDRNMRSRLGYSTSKGMDSLRKDRAYQERMLRKAVYHTNKIVPTDKVGLVAQVAEAYNNGHISAQVAEELLSKYGL